MSPSLKEHGPTNLAHATHGDTDCADLDAWSLDPYDWNLDSTTDQEDLEGLARHAAAVRADLDGDGVVGVADLAVLSAAWGPCPDPPEPCKGDLDCDGSVGMNDLMLLLGLDA